MHAVTLDPDTSLTQTSIAQVARGDAEVRVSASSKHRVEASRTALMGVLGDGQPHYGINTGFGSLASTRIDDSQIRVLQQNLIRSHAAGVGEPLPIDVVRGMLVVLAGSLSRGHSGVRLELVQALVDLLNARVTPVVPESGSVGASGDLAPLAHATLVLMGEGEAFYKGSRIPGGDALKQAGLQPIELRAKEGIALINGTHLMAARMALICEDLRQVFESALVACAMSCDGARTSHGFLDERIYEVRNQPGASRVAAALRGLLSGSTIVESHEIDDPRVQDPYSFRCAPLVLGAALDSIEACEQRLADELGAVTDNPLVFPTESGTDIVSAGCFHGMPVALPLDTLAIAIAHIAGISERRVYHMLSVFDPNSNLRAFLSPKPGIQSGLMIVQYSAAAMCNELIGLANPASVANLSTCAGMEDYNSWGPRSAAKAHRGVELCRSVIAIELLCAAEAVQEHTPHHSGHAIMTHIDSIRGRVPELVADRTPTPDIAAIDAMIRDGAFLQTGVFA